MDSIDEGAHGIPVSSISLQDGKLNFTVDAVRGSYEGKVTSNGTAIEGTIDKSLTSIEGTWTQGGGTFPLVLKRAKDAAELEQRRPQNPVKRYPCSALIRTSGLLPG